MRLPRCLLPLLLLAAGPAPAPPRPALWKVADADTTIWLFGTIHVLPAGTMWRSAAFDHALASADTLVVETVLDEEPGRVAGILSTMGRASGLPPLAERVPPAKRPALLALMKASGFPVAAFDGLKTWAAAVVLTGASLKGIGLGPGSAGVEPQVEAQFRSAKKPVEGLETPEQQLGYFDQLPEAAQRTFLAGVLDSPAQQRREFADTVAAWRKGDVAAIARAFADDPEFTPALRDLLVRRRDAAWAAEIQRRLATPGTIFVAVGAGHLVGPDSVQAMLAKRGIRAVRVR